MQTSRMSAKDEAREYILGLDLLGYGPVAFRAYQQTIATKIIPLRRKQEALLRPVAVLGSAGFDTPNGADVDAQVVELDRQAKLAWEDLLVELKSMWMASGGFEKWPGEDEEPTAPPRATAPTHERQPGEEG